MVILLRILLISLCLSSITSCAPSSLEDFLEEAEGITRSLIQELQAVHTRDDLLTSYHRLERLFNNLVNVMIAAREFQEKHAKEDITLTKDNHELSDRLRIELNRIYQIEGGRELIEKCQEQALNRLDAFEKRLMKKWENS